MISAMPGAAQFQTMADPCRPDGNQDRADEFHMVMLAPQHATAQPAPTAASPCCDHQVETPADQELAADPETTDEADPRALILLEGQDDKQLVDRPLRRWTSTESLLRSAAARAEPDVQTQHVTGIASRLGADAASGPYTRPDPISNLPPGCVTEIRTPQRTETDARVAAKAAVMRFTVAAETENRSGQPIAFDRPPPGIPGVQPVPAAPEDAARLDVKTPEVPVPPVLGTGKPLGSFPATTMVDSEKALLAQIAIPHARGVSEDVAARRSSRLWPVQKHPRRAMLEGRSLSLPVETGRRTNTSKNTLVVAGPQVATRAAWRMATDIDRALDVARPAQLPETDRQPRAQLIPSEMQPERPIQRIDTRGMFGVGRQSVTVATDAATMPGHQRQDSTPQDRASWVERHGHVARFAAESVRAVDLSFSSDAPLQRAAVNLDTVKLDTVKLPDHSMRSGISTRMAPMEQKQTLNTAPRAEACRMLGSVGATDMVQSPDQQMKQPVPGFSALSAQERTSGFDGDIRVRPWHQPDGPTSPQIKDAPRLPAQANDILALSYTKSRFPQEFARYLPPDAKQSRELGAPSYQTAEKSSQFAGHAIAGQRADSYLQRGDLHPFVSDGYQGVTNTDRSMTTATAQSDHASAGDEPLSAASLSLISSERSWPHPVRPERVVTQLRTPILEAIALRNPSSMQVALDPVELGRLRLTLTPTETGIQVQIMAERAESLDLLRRFSSDLVRDLKEMGFSDVDMQFSQQGRNGTAWLPEHARATTVQQPGSSPVDDVSYPVRHTSQEKGVDIRL